VADIPLSDVTAMINSQNKPVLIEFFLNLEEANLIMAFKNNYTIK
jgi:hypothetical protein